MPEFKVGSDGIQIGWNIFVAIAAGALGLYVATAVAPIDKRLSLTEQKVSHIEKEVAEVKDSVRWLERKAQK